MSGIEPTTIPTPTALSITRPTVSGLPTPTASTAIARGATPGRARFANSRPNGADGPLVTRYGSDQPDIPYAPLGRGTWATGHSRVSPFAITAYPVGDENCGTIGDIMVFGQDQWAWGAHLRRAQRARRVRLRRKQPNQSNPTTWRLAAMNMAIRGIDFDFGKEPADTFTRDQHPDLRADLRADLSCPNGAPGDSPGQRPGFCHQTSQALKGRSCLNNRRFPFPVAWVQHMLHHLAPNGSMALLLANGSMSSNSSGEGDIRRALIEADLVACMVDLPGQLFTNTQIPACIWFLTKNKAKRSRPGAAALRGRRGETLSSSAQLPPLCWHFLPITQGDGRGDEPGHLREPLR